MPYFEFAWDGENEEHLAQHGVTPEEFEEVVMDPDVSGRDKRHGPDRRYAIGETSNGKRLRCIYVGVDGITIYPITAYEV